MSKKRSSSAKNHPHHADLHLNAMTKILGGADLSIHYRQYQFKTTSAKPTGTVLYTPAMCFDN